MDILRHKSISYLACMPQPVNSVCSVESYLGCTVCTYQAPRGDDSTEGAKSASTEERGSELLSMIEAFSSRLQENRKAIGLMEK